VTQFCTDEVTYYSECEKIVWFKANSFAGFCIIKIAIRQLSLWLPVLLLVNSENICQISMPVACVATKVPNIQKRDAQLALWAKSPIVLINTGSHWRVQSIMKESLIIMTVFLYFSSLIYFFYFKISLIHLAFSTIYTDYIAWEITNLMTIFRLLSWIIHRVKKWSSIWLDII